ncbi:MAG TPA: hypothetical protein VJP41_03010 [Gaiellaceae bacterium]|nr:hypothetical protein [Gaiellaceae bacterium]
MPARSSTSRRRVSTAPTASWASSRPRTSDEGSGRGASSATPEGQPRPVFPSSFALLAATGGPVGLAVRCPSCHRLSLNLVSRPHIDVPFHNDREIGVVEHMFAEDALATLAEFRAELWSSSFDARRLALE